MAEKIDSIKIGNTTYDINLPPDATPTAASLIARALSAGSSVGTNGQFLKSNGTSIYWGSDNNSSHTHSAGAGLVLQMGTGGVNGVPVVYKAALTNETNYPMPAGSSVMYAVRVWGGTSHTGTLGVYVPWADTSCTDVLYHYVPTGTTTHTATTGTLTWGFNSAISSLTIDAAGHITAAKTLSLPNYNSCHSHSAGYGITISGDGSTISGTYIISGKPYSIHSIFSTSSITTGVKTLTNAPGSFEFIGFRAMRNSQDAIFQVFPTSIISYYNSSARQFFLRGSTTNYGKYAGIYFTTLGSRSIYVAQTTGLSGFIIVGLNRA